MTLTPISVPTTANTSISYDVNNVSPRLIPSLGALPVAATFGGAPFCSPVGVSSMGDPGVTYDRVFKSRPKGVVMSGPNDLYGHKYLKRFHLQTLICHNHNIAVTVYGLLTRLTLRFKDFMRQIIDTIKKAGMHC